MFFVCFICHIELGALRAATEAAELAAEMSVQAMNGHAAGTACIYV